MDTELRQRVKPVPEPLPDPVPAPNLAAGLTTKAPTIEKHPSGKESHGTAIQLLRSVSLAIFFLTSVITYDIRFGPFSLGSTSILAGLLLIK